MPTIKKITSDKPNGSGRWVDNGSGRLKWIESKPKELLEARLQLSREYKRVRLNTISEYKKRGITQDTIVFPVEVLICMPKNIKLLVLKPTRK